ncbi:MAG: ABC transporter permease [Actinobacteria bacterium]|nr:ABC transporter permease [Actinomycetota bacterium]NCW94403.1 ABC transporter permease [Actinomycetota bacterium]NCX35905.1 ABC transporter permease [Actinomycetota bacterium]
MIAFIIRRLLVAIPVLFFASVLTFFLVINSGDPLETLRMKPGVSPQVIRNEEIRLGLDKSFVERYSTWAGKFVQGDLGVDMKSRPVWPPLWSAIKYTMRLVLLAELLALTVGLMIGVVSGVRQYTAFDYSTTFVSFLFFSLPVFWFANLLKVFGAIEFNDWLENPGVSLVFGALTTVLFGGSGYLVGRRRERQRTSRSGARFVWAGWSLAATGLLMLSVGLHLRNRKFDRFVKTLGSEPRILADSFGERLWAYIGHGVLPVIVLFAISYAGYSRYMRASVLEQLNAEHVRLARAKGLSETRVIVRHAFRNALIPIATIASLSWGGLIAGAVITERVFAWNGMGDFFLDSLANPTPDPNRLLAFVMITAAATIFFNIIADVIYALLDPRIRVNS